MDVIKSMRVFQQVVDSKSFTKASEQLNMVPSAVSRQISELESWLNVRLINRTTRSFHLTDLGQQNLAKMQTILEQVNNLKSSQDSPGNLTGSINITSAVMLGRTNVSSALSKIKSLHPDIEVNLTLENRHINMVKEGYDLAIKAGNLSDSNFYARRIGFTIFRTVVSPEYLKSHPAITKPYDLKSHNCLSDVSAHGTDLGLG